MRILISGSNGFVGNALVEHLTGLEHETWRLVRQADPSKRSIVWDPENGRLEAAACEGFDAVVHLGGANIATGRWTKQRKKNVRNSRINSTRFLALTLSGLKQAPTVFACASAVGFYGDCGNELLGESAPSGAGFLAEVTREWERACEPASARDIRIVNCRFGIVLGKEDGALAKMRGIFRSGFGGRIGNGRQYWSWISLTDAVRAITLCLESDRLRGPVNLVAPGAVTNREFTKTLGRALHRPTLIPLPAWAARLTLGEMADATLLASTRAEPAALAREGFRFAHPDLATALKAEI